MNSKLTLAIVIRHKMNVSIIILKNKILKKNTKELNLFNFKIRKIWIYSKIIWEIKISESKLDGWKVKL